MSMPPPPPPPGGTPLPPPGPPGPPGGWQPGPPPGPIPYTPTASAPPPGRKRLLGLPVLGWVLIVAVAAIGVGAVMVLGGDDDSPSTSGSTVPGTTTATDTAPNGTGAPDTSTPDTSTQATDEPATTSPGEPNEGEVAGAPGGVTGTHADPVASGEVADIGGGWRLQVLAVADGTAGVAAENEFNDPPPAGSSFTLVTVALGYYGADDPKSAFEPTISAVGAGNVELDTDCGLIPGELSLFVDVFAGGVITGNLCFVTTPADLPDLQLYAVGNWFEGEEIFLAATPPAGDPVPLARLDGPQPDAASTAARQAPAGVGTMVDVGGGWSLRVDSGARDLTAQIAAENPYNDPPPEGYQFVGLDVTYQFNGAGSGSVWDVLTKVASTANVEHSGFCGLVPGALDTSSDVFAGGSVSGTICFVVPAGATGLLLYATGSYELAPQWFATA